MNDMWCWVPGKSIAPFVFGELIEKYIDIFSLQKREPDCPAAGWETYDSPKFESWVIVTEGRIIEVYCADEIQFKGNDLLRMRPVDVYILLGEVSSKEDDVGLGYALYYDELGLTLFVVDDFVRAGVCGVILEKDNIVNI